MKHTAFLKRFFCPVLALVLALGVLTGCGSSAPASPAPASPNADSAPASEPAPELREINEFMEGFGSVDCNHVPRRPYVIVVADDA